jgi:hypothetical protein
MSGVAHLHRKVVGSLSVGSLPTYLLFVFGLGGCLLILSGGSMQNIKLQIPLFA